MAVIVAGKISTKIVDREAFLRKSMSSVSLARRTKGCLDFSVSADLIEQDRINIFELWTDWESLHAFRDQGPSEDLSSLIVAVDVKEYEVER